MNQKNLDYLSDQVKYTGFGDALSEDLKAKMEQQAPEFKIFHQQDFGKDNITATLNFKKSDQSDMYFFNSYQLALKKEGAQDLMTQHFYINKGSNITLKEAYNLMSGRAVNKDLTNKEGQIYNAWVQIDMKQTDTNGNYQLKHFNQNYGYDLAATLAKHPIKELAQEPDHSRLLESLQKGNRQSVTFIQGGTEQKHFIEANPQFKTINVYDSNMQRINNRQGQNEKQGQREGQSAKQSTKNKQKQAVAANTDETPRASNKKKKKQGHFIG